MIPRFPDHELRTPNLLAVAGRMQPAALAADAT